MKIAVCSDLHLEFGPISLENKDNADVLILSGDICVARDLREKDDPEFDRFDRNKRLHQFFQECSERFTNVIYVMGNHEHYNGDFAKTYNTLKERLGYLSNLHIMEKEFVVIGSVCFAAGTLWTDMNNEDRATMAMIRTMMNDFNIIKNSNNKVHFRTSLPDPDNPGQTTYRMIERPATFMPADAVEDH